MMSTGELEWMLDGAQRRAFLGEEAAADLFGIPVTGEPEGLSLTINSENYTVAGFLPGVHAQSIHRDPLHQRAPSPATTAKPKFSSAPNPAPDLRFESGADTRSCHSRPRSCWLRRWFLPIALATP